MLRTRRQLSSAAARPSSRPQAPYPPGPGRPEPSQAQHPKALGPSQRPAFSPAHGPHVGCTHPPGREQAKVSQEENWPHGSNTRLRAKCGRTRCFRAMFWGHRTSWSHTRTTHGKSHVEADDLSRLGKPSSWWKHRPGSFRVWHQPRRRAGRFCFVCCNPSRNGSSWEEAAGRELRTGHSPGVRAPLTSCSVHGGS